MDSYLNHYPSSSPNPVDDRHLSAFREPDDYSPIARFRSLCGGSPSDAPRLCRTIGNTVPTGPNAEHRVG
ncbi:hypothetical protein NC796_17945 [Aliifodinibius sp. S!AR15-10]|uniref:hypothetical protein n=1 Tax=Aliifodinibius sp. S!AR15-10 TaxID=2950437 RepID=UPI0028618B11|nr:hypothetical protein [Aliifodinibius sp. S!AR15-10]MDR8393044.1 hypothetical protein [Aliifodinibius sp. S!AR15-10]